MSATAAEIAAAHRSRAVAPEETIAQCYARIRALGDPAIFISLREEADARAEARALATSSGSERSLFGVPVAVKDNIDVAGLPTTAACPAFAYDPEKDAAAVARLRAAGAIVIGKTNLDQFATGLVGVRSPYGSPRNPFDAAMIPGGSSSGSAVAVAAGLVPLSLGTDTAGSGRVPAALNNVVGLKPSLGLVSTAGVVPACRTLDCVSVFALTVDDAALALSVLAGVDESDPYSRPLQLAPVGPMPHGVRLGVPSPAQRVFFDDAEAARSYEASLTRLQRLGAHIVEVDMQPFDETARLLYEGPWLAERYLAARALLTAKPDALHPVTRQIIAAGAHASAADAFTAFYRLAALRRACDRVFTAIDALALPTVPTHYSVAQIEAGPIALNSRLGTYTNFVNLLDLCGLALPASMRADGMPAGITLLAPAGRDAELAAIGRIFHADTGLPLGATGQPQPRLADLSRALRRDEIAIAVVGAHLAGMPLNRELRALDARLLAETATSADYRLYALPGTAPPKPGLLRVADGAGAAIAVEVWALGAAAFGRFVAAVPPPLTIGSVRLADGGTAKGFLVEAQAVEGARDISSFGGWRAFVTAGP
ncbi:MAG: allophanate hydrolase [Hyphomicrobiales bacterium]|nr:allophanate hydrolase [Hyphomicrobiales bacterium]